MVANSRNLQSNMYVVPCQVDTYTHIGIVVFESGHVVWYFGRLAGEGFVFNPDAYGRIFSPSEATALMQADGTINPLYALHFACVVEKSANPPAPAA